MININTLFLSDMLKEIGYAFQHGVALKTPVTISLPPKEIDYKNLVLPKSVIEFYNQTSKLEILWEIHPSDMNLKQFQEDPFLKENYLDNNYDWGVISDYLSGYINITKIEDIFNPNFCKEQAYYYTLNSINENPDHFFPFDTCWSLTACLKKEGNNIIDNIWLVHTDAESIYNMKITIEDYLNLAYLSKGFHYWQLIYLFKEKVEFHELMQRFLPKMLPHISLKLEDFNISKKN